MKLEQALIALLGSALLVPEARSEIISSSETHFVLRHEATSLLPPSTIWERLVQPADWWHPEHTYSGDAKNLSLDLQAGGLWREDWKGHSVQHGRVLFVDPEKVLRLEAPFGPLQGSGAYTVWTITISATESGSTVVFDEAAMAAPSARLDQLASAVDFVKSEALRRLLADVDSQSGSPTIQ